MNFTIPLLIDSIAGVLKMQYPTYPVYTGPNQQGTDTPCFFIFVTPSTITDEVGKRWARDIGIDIVFFQRSTKTGCKNRLGRSEETVFVFDELQNADIQHDAGTSCFTSLQKYSWLPL